MPLIMEACVGGSLLGGNAHISQYLPVVEPPLLPLTRAAGAFAGGLRPPHEAGEIAALQGVTQLLGFSGVREHTGLDAEEFLLVALNAGERWFEATKQVVMGSLLRGPELPSSSQALHRCYLDPVDFLLVGRAVRWDRFAILKGTTRRKRSLRFLMPRKARSVRPAIVCCDPLRRFPVFGW